MKREILVNRLRYLIGIAVQLLAVAMVAFVISCSSGSDETPTATSEPTTLPTSTPLLPTSTLEPSPTPETSPTPEPTATSEPTVLPTSTPVPPTPTSLPTNTATPEATDTATPEPTSTPTPEPTDTATPEPTSTPTPEPSPAEYEIESVQWNIRGPETDKIAANFSVRVVNSGETARRALTPLLVTVDGADPVEVIEAPPLDAGESSTLGFDIRLEPGQRNLRIQVDDSTSNVVVDVLASDLALSLVSYQIVSDGIVQVKANLTNIGSLPTAPVNIYAGDSMVATSRPLRVGEIQGLTLDLPLPVGRHQVRISAGLDEREVTQVNNSETLSIGVEYVLLDLSADSASTQGYNRDGNAIVHIGFTVSNAGVASSGEFNIGVVCPQSESEDECDGMARVKTLAPGEVYKGIFVASFPQGQVSAEFFAGELEDGYRWGDGNVTTVTVDVPIQPEVDLVFTADTLLLGYYSDGTAGIRLSADLRNNGSRALEGPRDVLITCRRGEEIVSSCSGLMTFDLVDGYGPSQASLDLRAPTGGVELAIDGVDISETHEVATPRRIVGVDRSIWRCMMRTTYNYTVAPRGSCGGLSSDTVVKWRTDSVVTYWADGDSRYIDEFEDALGGLTSLLSMNFQRVPRQEGADIVVNVGISESDAERLGYTNCDGIWGCTSYSTDSDGFISSAEIVVFENMDLKYESLKLTREAVQFSMKHHILRALVPLGYRNIPDSILSIDSGLRIPELSSSDREIVRIYSDPLVVSGATLSEVEELIVFTEDVLDPLEPSPPSDRDILVDVFTTLHEAGSVQYQLQGGWSGGTCLDNFQGSQVTTSDFTPYRALHYRLSDADERMYHFRRSAEGSSEYWDGAGTRWRRVGVQDEQDLIRQTAWNPEYSDPLIMLASILWFADAGDIDVNRRTEDAIIFEIRLDDAFVTPLWAGDKDVDINMTVDLENLQIERYSMEWDFQVGGLVCDDYHVEGKLIEYGAQMIIPSTVRENSSIVD